MTLTLLERYNKLLEAYQTGVRTVEYEDQRISYRSTNDMERILANMRAQLGLSDDTSISQINRRNRRRRSTASYDDGLYKGTDAGGNFRGTWKR